MRKFLRSMAVLCAALLCLCGTAFAADTAVSPSGVYNLKVESGYTSTVSVEPQTAAGAAVTAGTATIDGKTVSGFYANAEKLKVTYSAATASAQYLILGLDDGTGVPTEGNIVYIDQTGADSTSVTFSLYPSRLEAGKTYSIYLSSSADTGITGFTKVTSFQYYVPYTLGDANEDGNIDTFDAMKIINHVVGNSTLTGNALLAADVDKNGEVNTFDAMRIINYVVGNIREF